jgi:hypothetical protein
VVSVNPIDVASVLFQHSNLVLSESRLDVSGLCVLRQKCNLLELQTSDEVVVERVLSNRTLARPSLLGSREVPDVVRVGCRDGLELGGGQQHVEVGVMNKLVVVRSRASLFVLRTSTCTRCPALPTARGLEPQSVLESTRDQLRSRHQ